MMAMAQAEKKKPIAISSSPSRSQRQSNRFRTQKILLFCFLLLCCVIVGTTKTTTVEAATSKDLEEVVGGTSIDQKRNLMKPKRKKPKKKKKWCYQTKSKFQSVCRLHNDVCATKIESFQLVDSKGNSYASLKRGVNKPPVLGPISDVNVRVQVQKSKKCPLRIKKRKAAVIAHYKYNRKKRKTPLTGCVGGGTVFKKPVTFEVGKHSVTATARATWPKPEQKNKNNKCCACLQDETVTALFKVVAQTPPTCTGLLGSAKSKECPAVDAGCIWCMPDDVCSACGFAADPSSFDCMYRCKDKFCCPLSLEDEDDGLLVIRRRERRLSQRLDEHQTLTTRSGTQPQEDEYLHQSSLGAQALVGQQQHRRLEDTMPQYSGNYHDFKKLFEALEALRELIGKEVDELNENPLVAEARAYENLVKILTGASEISEEVYDAFIQFAKCNSEPLKELIKSGADQAEAVLGVLNGFLAILKGMASDEMKPIFDKLAKDHPGVATKAAIFALKVWIKSQMPSIKQNVADENYVAAADALVKLKNLPSDFPLTKWPIELASLVAEQVKIWLLEKLKQLGQAAGEAAAKAILKRMCGSAAGAAAILFIANDIVNLIQAFIDLNDIDKATEKYNEKLLEIIRLGQSVKGVVKPVNSATTDPIWWNLSGKMPKGSTLTARFSIKCWKQKKGSSTKGDGEFVKTPLEVTKVDGKAADPKGSPTVVKGIGGKKSGRIRVEYKIPPRAKWNAGRPGPCYVCAEVEIHRPPNEKNNLKRVVFLGVLP